MNIAHFVCGCGQDSSWAWSGLQPAYYKPLAEGERWNSLWVILLTVGGPDTHPLKPCTAWSIINAFALNPAGFIYPALVGVRIIAMQINYIVYSLKINWKMFADYSAKSNPNQQVISGL